MKKIYSLLAAACVSVSAFALPTGNLKYEGKLDIKTFSDDMLQKMVVSPEQSNEDGVIMKAIDKNTNEERAVIMALMQWNIPIEEFPYYELLFATQNASNSNDKSFYQLYINWPTYGALDNDCRVTKTADDGSEYPYWEPELVKAKYGDKAFKPMSYEDFVAAWGETYVFSVPGLYYMPSVVNYATQNPSNPSPDITLADGTEVFAMTAQLQDNNWNLENAVVWDWTAFDQGTSNVNINVTIPYTNSFGSTNRLGSVNCDLAGDAVVLGFMPIFWDTIGQVHIFNGGRQSAGDEWTWNYIEQSSAPLNYYYLALCDETMGYFAYNTQTQERVECYTNDTLPVGVGNYTGAPAYRFEDDYHLTFLAGAIWAPENSEYPYGVWSMKEPEMKGETVRQAPEAYNLVVGGYRNDAAGLQDGFWGMYEGYRQYGNPGETFLGIGDKTKGLNFYFCTPMTNGYPILGSYTGEIYFHATPEHWVSEEAVMLPAIGTGDFDVTNGPNSSVKVVEESNAPVVSTSYYNFQGQRLSSEPANGMYIIRTVKADGTVKATKVAK